MDVVGYLVSLLIASTIALYFGAAPTAPSLVMSLALIVGSLAMFAALGLYSGMGMHPIFEFRQCMLGVCLSFVFIAGVSIQTGNAMAILFSFPIMLAVVPVVRSTTRHIFAKRSWWGINCVVLACDKRVKTLFGNHLKNIPAGLRPVGFLQDEVPNSISDELKSFHLGTDKDAHRVMLQKGAYVALLHRRGRPDHEIAEYVKQNLSQFYRVIIVPDDERLPSLWAMGQNSGIMLEDKLLQPGSQIVKRTAGLLISITALIVGMPLFLLIAAWLKITSPGPLFYGHERIGKNGRRFKAWKFRSMCVNADQVLEETLAKNPEMRAEWEATQKLQNDPRVSSAGRFLRKTSLDELPQLWNVIRGEMALVGPRPIVANEVEKYDDKFETYLRVTPGVTGFWQVSGRNLTSYEKRVELDDYYVRNWSLWFDLYILGRTIKTVLFREGAF
jgi:Undecaprenyl-phosphate galactose phosphotransferase WbaP